MLCVFLQCFLRNIDPPGVASIQLNTALMEKILTPKELAETLRKQSEESNDRTLVYRLRGYAENYSCTNDCEYCEGLENTAWNEYKQAREAYEKKWNKKF